MKACLVFIYISAMCASLLHAQVQSPASYPLTVNNADNPCISAEEYKIIEKQIADYHNRAGLKNTEAGVFTTALSWPLRTVAGLKDCGYYVIVNYVDQDTTTGIRDYNCGSVTYDGHTGTDIVIEPYPFYKMDNDQVDVVAAAPGTIIGKTDGNFDKNCAKNNLTANYIIVQHADGSEALYWHMKKNSLTAKTIGQMVVVGEFLGKVGSSGSSTLPHLHFEVWSGATFSTRNDPYAGSCNLLNANTWWANQKPYKEPAIIKVQANHVAPVLPACPATETPNEDSCFTAGGTALFYTWIRNDTIGMTTNMRIVNPNNTTFSSWSHNSTTTFNLAAYSYSRTLPSTAGTYTFEAVFNGDTCSQTFRIACSGSGVFEQSLLQENITVDPNPFSNEAVLHADHFLKQATISIENVLGQSLRQMITVSGDAVTIRRMNIPGGLYILRLTEDNKLIAIKKILITD